MIRGVAAYCLQLEVHELRPVVGVQQDPVGRELLILTGSLGEVQELHAHCHVLQDGDDHFIVHLYSLIVDDAAQGTPLWAHHHLKGALCMCIWPSLIGASACIL